MTARHESSPDADSISGTSVPLLLQTQHYSGPIPPATELARYDAIQPGLADRLVRMAEKEQEHRHAMDAEVMRRDYAEARVGQCAALGIGMLAVLTGGYLSIHGAEWSGACIGGGGVIGLVSVFVYGRRQAAPHKCMSESDTGSALSRNSR